MGEITVKQLVAIREAAERRIAAAISDALSELQQEGVAVIGVDVSLERVRAVGERPQAIVEGVSILVKL